jgi:two-component system chemotaxis response regulator CheB
VGPRREAGPIDVIAIGVSTGGPTALAQLLPALPADLPVPVVVVQHMPAVFTSLLAERLDASSGLHVVEAAAGMALDPGTVLLAPGGERHMQVRREGTAVRVALVDSPPEHSCRPAVDVLFRSVTSVYGARALAVVLTGMGFDGSGAAPALHAAGARILVQDEETSVVWGMPGAIVRAGLADEVLPLPEVAPALVRRSLAHRRPARAVASTVIGR